MLVLRNVFHCAALRWVGWGLHRHIQHIQLAFGPLIEARKVLFYNERITDIALCLLINPLFCKGIPSGRM
jgi:hypothetical protein